MTTLTQASHHFINGWRGPDLDTLHAIPRQDCERLARELRDEWPEAPPVRRPTGVDVGRAALIGCLRRDPHAAVAALRWCLEAGTELLYRDEYGVDVRRLAPTLVETVADMDVEERVRVAAWLSAPLGAGYLGGVATLACLDLAWALLRRAGWQSIYETNTRLDRALMQLTLFCCLDTT